MNSKALTRQELYDLVWKTPMVKLATEFGISDNGLKKKCIKHNIPRPPMGYWLKIEHGKSVNKPPLPKIKDPYLETIEFHPKPVPTYEIASSAQNNEDPILIKATEFKLPEKINRYHSVVRQYRKSVNKTFTDRYGHINFGDNKTGVVIRITENTFDRVSHLLHSLILLFSIFGWKLVEQTSSRSDKTYHAFVYEGEEIHIYIKEKITQSIHVKTEKELKKNYSWGPKHDYKATGLLELSLSNIYQANFRTTWRDTTKVSIEDQFKYIAQAASRTFELKKIRTIEAEKEREIRAIEKEKQQERQRLHDIEEKRREELFKLTADQATTAALNSLINSFEEADYPPEFKPWIEWAKSVADSIDPIKNPERILARHKEIEEKPQWRWKNL